MPSTEKRTIVDSHIHFWDPNVLTYEWLSSVPAINRAYLPTDLAQQASSVDLHGIVFVQADCVPDDGLHEAEWVASLARQEPRIQGIVAFAPVENGEAVHGQLEALAAVPLVRGVRRLIQSEPDGFCVQPAFVEGIKLLPEFGFSFDICIVHHQMADAVALVDQCPKVSFVLDHIGKPDIAGQMLEPWREQIRTLASYSNVACKLSGLVTEADHERWTREDLRPYIDHVIEVFGIDRVLYGGDWPVSLLATSYPRWIETLAWATASLGEDAQDKLFCRNARAFYRG